MTSIGPSSAQMFVASSSQYFSLDDILASQERIPLTIKQDLPQLGFLDSQSHYQNDPTILTNGTKLELPLWMAKSLKAQGRAKLDLPQTWGMNQRNIITADANVLDLHKYGPFFYQSGCHIVKLVSKGHNLDENWVLPLLGCKAKLNSSHFYIQLSTNRLRGTCFTYVPGFEKNVFGSFTDALWEIFEHPSREKPEVTKIEQRFPIDK